MAEQPTNTLSPVKAEPKARKLKPDDVEYLALEGGGGKGFAFVGAVGVLEELGVMDHVKGFSGASAGAITSFLLSIGYTKDRMLKYMLNTDFNRFFDPPQPRTRPMVGGGELVKDNDEEKEMIESLESLPLKTGFGAGILASGLAGPLGQLLLIYGLWNALDQYGDIDKIMKEKGNKPPFSLLLKYWKQYIAYMGRDMGIFSGIEARREFARLIAEPVIFSGRPRDITFEDHFKFFKKKLLITGTNLALGKTVLFSVDETPDFPVADAVRISMSLPFIYKPYVITETRKNWPPPGVYVDGGVWNNLPFREFDSEPTDDQPSSSLGTTQRKTKARTLGLRLEVTPQNKIENFGDFAKTLGTFGLFGSGETQVLSKYEDQNILLDTRGLDLIDFKPPPKDRDQAIKRARRATWRYFDRPVPPADVDEADDEET